MFAVVVIAITALNVRTVLSSDRSYDMNTSTIEALGGKMILLMVEKSEMWRDYAAKAVEAGKCYAKRTEVKGNGYCRFLSMDRGDFRYCNSFWMGVLELCVNK